MKYKVVISACDKEKFLREMFMVRNKLFASKIKITTDKRKPKLVTIESDDYLCVEDVLIVELRLSCEDARKAIEK